MNHHHTATCLSILGTAIAALIAQPVGAQTAPDAGQTLRDLQRPSAPPAGRPTPKIVVPEDENAALDAGTRFVVQKIRIDGAKHIPETELQPLVARLAGKEVSLGDLREGARRITRYYRDRGYFVARAYLPQQEIRDGVLTIAVLEGQLSKYTVNNQSLVDDKTIDSVLAARKLPGKVIHATETDRALLLLSDLPGVGRVGGNLKPGDQVGTSDLLVDVPPGESRDGEISLDNFGNRYTGRERLNGHVDFNSPSHIGDKVSLSATLTDEALLYGRLAYDRPVGPQGLRLGAALTSSHYELGREFESLDATGVANTLSASAAYPALRGLDRNVWLAANVEHRRLRDDIGTTNTHTRRSATVTTLDAYGDLTDGLGGPRGGYNTWRASVGLGDVSIDTDVAKANDAAGPRTAGRYEKLQVNASRQQSLAENTSASLALSGQTASKNLDSSEKFTLGGRYGVRAYPQGEGAGDEGWLVNLELRQRLSTLFQASVFYDSGKVRYSKNAYVAGDSSRSLRGYGAGFGLERGAASLNLYAAWRSTGPAVTSPDSRSRIWAVGTWQF